MPVSRLFFPIIAALAAFGAATGASAGSTAYDVSVLLNQPHPFAAPPAIRPTPPPVQHRRPVRIHQVAAAPIRRDPPGSNDPSYLTLAVGYYDFNDNEDAAEFRVEWRGQKFFWALRPLAGIMGTSDSSLYAYGGIAMDVYFGSRIVMTPSFAAGLFDEGNGKDLGSAIEFRPGLELSYRLDNRTRIGLMFYHLSNASIDNNNPGTEVLSIGYSIPLN
jgi:hypothetical protein